MITLILTILFDMAHEEGKNVLILSTRNVQAMDISGPQALEAVFKLCQKKRNDINIITCRFDLNTLKVT